MPDSVQNPGQTIATNPALLVCMMGMVLVNLLFVQLTEATEAMWLAPLYLLTLATPLLERFKENLWYRSTWNIGVIAFFGLLVQHATSRNLEFVLQDGLILAVLCQVHLLNNLHAEQRPDLLFLNSFLIAIITGYITVDLGFAAAFLLYAPFFLIGMQFLSVVRPGVSLPSTEWKAILWDGVRRSLLLMGCALVVFLYWPRDFHREAMFAKYFDVDTTSDTHEIGFAETLKLRKHDKVKTRERIVLTVRPQTGKQADVPELWRGATLPVQGLDDAWRALGRPMRNQEPASDEAWASDGRGLLRTPTNPPDGSLEFDVVRLDASTKRLFLPRDAESVRLDPRHTQAQLEPDGDGTIVYPNPGELHYTVSLGGSRPPAVLEPNPLAYRGVFTRLNPSARSNSAVELAKRLRKKLPAEASEREIVKLFAGHLRSEYTYRFPGDPKAAGSLNEFLTGTAGGHCEFFASALTTMLRSIQVPCRVVTGYRSNRWDESTGTRTFFNVDAHAWVEVFDAGSGWYTVDPTPPADPLLREDSFWETARQDLGSLWNRVTGFDAESRKAAMAWLQAAPGRALQTIGRSPWQTAGCCLLCVLILVAWRFGKRRSIPKSIRKLKAAFVRAGVRTETTATPREWLCAPGFEQLSAERKGHLERAVAEHEQQRYAA